ncbi:MAG: hypothetical protein AAF808_00095 [Cyanobacteria bacterium P01_D01_bin.2]
MEIVAIATSIHPAIHSNASKKVTQAYCTFTLPNKTEPIDLVPASSDTLIRQEEIGC